MTFAHGGTRRRSLEDPVIGWLLDSDPAIRWQVMRDLTDASAESVAAERSRVASQGWGPRLLAQQRPDGHWGDGLDTPLWWSNLYSLLFLRDLGLDPTSRPARTAIDRVRNNVTWGPWHDYSAFFEGEVEPCINGRVVALGAYFGERSDRPDERVEEAVTTVRTRRHADECWLLDVRHRNTLHEELAGTVGAPNRWITLRALRVLDWYENQQLVRAT